MKHIAVLLFAFFLLSASYGQKIFVGNRFNDVANDLPLIIQNNYQMTEKNSDMKAGIINVYFIPKVFTSKQQSLSLHYTIDADGIIKKVKVDGTFQEVVSLFIGYWKTKADYNTKNAVVEKHFISDVIRLTKENKSASIIISGS